jgi:hypothetical protein
MIFHFATIASQFILNQMERDSNPPPPPHPLLLLLPVCEENQRNFADLRQKSSEDFEFDEVK